MRCSDSYHFEQWIDHGENARRNVGGTCWERVPAPFSCKIHFSYIQFAIHPMPSLSVSDSILPSLLSFPSTLSTPLKFIISFRRM